MLTCGQNLELMGHYGSEMQGDPTPEEIAIQKRWIKVENKLYAKKLGDFKPGDLPLLLRFYENKRQTGDLEKLEELLEIKKK